MLLQRWRVSGRQARPVRGFRWRQGVLGDTVAADIDSKWSLLDEDALNKGLAARRLQPMIMFQSTDSSNEDDGSLFNLVWLSIPVILLVSFCLAPGDSDSNFCTDWDCCETKHTVASDTYTGCWNGTEWNDIPPYFKKHWETLGTRHICGKLGGGS